jgi:hypothetical protein
MKDIMLRVFDRLLSKTRRNDELHIYDFDDTLVKTDSRVHVKNFDGKKTSMSPHEYVSYVPVAGDVFDYTDFEVVINPSPIMPMVDKMKKSIEDLGPDNVFVLTARGNPEPVKEYLATIGLGDIRVYAVGNSDPNAKADVVRNQILSKGYRRVEFYDDAPKYIASVSALSSEFPDVNINAVQV